ncbi:MAG: FTR1 family protein [Anaerolineales bacterium]
MIAAFLLALREGLEAALIVGLVLGVLVKVRRTGFARMVWAGVATAIAVSLTLALVLNAAGAQLTGAAETIFEGFTMLLAAGVLTWMIFWMQRQGRRVQQELEVEVRLAATRGQTWGLFGIAFVAVVREGIETTLFLTAAAMNASTQTTLVGGLLGLAVAALLGWGLFAAAVKLDVQRFFRVTGALLILFAAGLVAHAIHEFNAVGWVPAIVEHVWDINPVLNESAGLGLILKTLFGYNGNPSLTEVFAYVGYYCVILIGLRRATRPQPILTAAAVD